MMDGIAEDPLEGDWYLELEGQEGAPTSELPRFSFKAGQIFQADKVESVGTYTVQDRSAKIVLGDDALLTVGLPGISDDALSGTLTSLHGDDKDGAALSDAARLIRATDAAAAH